MTKTFTRNDVIRYLYNEMIDNEKLEFVKALEDDSKLLSIFKLCKNQMKELKHSLLEPPEHIIENVLKYSANYKAG